MGFYAPAQIVGDARTNGVEVREIDVSFSFSQNTLEPSSPLPLGERSDREAIRVRGLQPVDSSVPPHPNPLPGGERGQTAAEATPSCKVEHARYHAVRLGFRQIDGFKWADPDEERLKQDKKYRQDMQAGHSLLPLPACGERVGVRGIPTNDGCDLSAGTPSPGSHLTMRSDLSPQAGRGEDDWGERIVAARTRRPFTSLEDFARDTGLPKRALILLADADAFRSIGLDRRAALWAVRRLPDDVPLPLFEIATAREQPDEDAQPLPVMPLPEQVVADYQTIRLSLKGHPMEFLRPMFTQERVVTCNEVSHANDKKRMRCAGVVLVRQRPGSAKGVVFMTLEDETGIANIVVWPKVMERFRKEVMGARLILVEGTIQSSPEKVVHLVADRLFDRSHEMARLSESLVNARPMIPAGPALIEPLHDDRRQHPDNPAQKIRHPRNVRILPRSRDFH